MYLDFIQLCFGVLILCSLEYSFREAAKERGKERRPADKTSFQVKSLAKKPTVTVIDKPAVVLKVITPRPKRARINSLPVYRSKEMDEALREARS